MIWKTLIKHLSRPPVQFILWDNLNHFCFTSSVLHFVLSMIYFCHCDIGLVCFRFRFIVTLLLNVEIIYNNETNKTSVTMTKTQRSGITCGSDSRCSGWMGQYKITVWDVWNISIIVKQIIHLLWDRVVDMNCSPLTYIIWKIMYILRTDSII